MAFDWNTVILGILGSTWRVFLVSWWVVVPLALFFIWRDFWLWGKNLLWKRGLSWTLLEIKIPRNILKTPKAMENIFSTLHALYGSDPGFEDRYFKGQDLQWFSCEIVGFAGGVHFFIRTPKSHRNLVENSIYAEYPDAEIAEVEDYVELMPQILPNAVYDLFGMDFILAKPDPYPIKTYEFFEANVDEQRLDPISAITEVMSRLREGESIWLQYLVKPVSSKKIQAEGEAIRDKIMQRKKPPKPKTGLDALISGLGEFIYNLFHAPRIYPQWAGAPKKDDAVKMPQLSPGERNVLEGIEQKISKLCFETVVRFVYLDRADSFSPANVAAVNGALKQFNTTDMNSFRPIGDTMTIVSSKKLTTKSWFRKNKLFIRKRRMYDRYRLRWFPGQASTLNTEELATLFHFPIVSVESPMLRRLETRKGEPPPNIPFSS